MVIRVAKPNQPVRTVIQRAGYAQFRDPRTGEFSFVKRLGKYFYPRFHLYVKEGQDEVQLNLHLDQKQPSYAGSSKHAGEYDGQAVEAEAQRITQFFQ